MKIKLLFITMMLLFCTLFVACGTEHTHAFGEWETTKAATCAADGLKQRFCSCGETQTSPVVSTGHLWGEWKETSATCTTDGSETRTCDCGETQTNTISATGHVWGEWIETGATCTADGSKTRTCDCGETQTNTISATGHVWGEWIETNATCTADGSKTRTCACGETESQPISAIGHKYTSSITAEATCATDGEEKFICSNCNDSYTERIPAAHTWAPATCTVAKTCTMCQATDGAALGHKWVDATSTAPQTCSACGETVGSPMTWYGEGSYKVGVDIPAGQYYVKQDSTYSAYIQISSDSNGDNILFNENFDNHHFVTLKNGEYFELTRGKCTSVENITLDVDTSNIPVGFYRVGIDIPAGEYQLTCNSNYSGYYAIYDNDTSGRDIQSNDNFPTTKYVTVKNGDYIQLHRCDGKLISSAGTIGGSTSAFTSLKNYIVLNGTYESDDNEYKLDIYVDYSSDYTSTYTYYMTYSNADDEITWYFFSYSSSLSSLVSITIDKEVSGNYIWVYVDSNQTQMVGTITASSFTSNSTVEYSYDNITSSSTRNQIRELSSIGCKLVLLSVKQYACPNAGVSLSDFGFIFT